MKCDNKYYREKQKEYYHRNRARLLEKNRVYCRLWRYGLTEEAFNSLVEAQHNKCAICKLNFNLSDKKTTPYVDHDHDTNEVRGLLCMLCNLHLCTIKFHTNAIKYLKKDN